MAEGVDTVARHTVTKEVNLEQCQNYRAISVVRYPNKIALRVIHGRLRAKAEELLAEERTGCIPGRSTVQRIFNSRVIMEKRL